MHETFLPSPDELCELAYYALTQAHRDDATSEQFVDALNAIGEFQRSLRGDLLEQGGNR